MYRVVLSFVTLLILCSPQLETNFTCDEGHDTCLTCFNMLVSKTITSDRNQYNMQRAFFPPEYSPPIYVIVQYSCASKEDQSTWFWSAYAFYALFNPLSVHQFTSLFFSDPTYLTSTLELTLADECCGILADEYNETMRLLTQRVRIVYLLHVQTQKGIIQTSQ